MPHPSYLHSFWMSLAASDIEKAKIAGMAGHTTGMDVE
jgi:hypothetical protein